MLATVELFKDIGFDGSYGTVRDFASESDRDDWFADRVDRVFNDINYDKVEKEFKLEVTYADAMTWSYCVIRLSDDTDVYAFVDDVRIVNDRTVAFSLRMDQWQMNAGIRGQARITSAFVQRKHMDRSRKDVYPVDEVTGYKVSPDVYPLTYLHGKDVQDNEVYVSWAVVCYTKDTKIKFIAFPVATTGTDTNRGIIPCDWYDGQIHQWYDLSYLDVMFNDLSIDPEGVQYVNIVPDCGADDPTDVRLGSGGVRLNVASGYGWTFADHTGRGYLHRTAGVVYGKRRVKRVAVSEHRAVSEPMELLEPCMTREIYGSDGTLIFKIPNNFYREIMEKETIDGEDYYGTVFGYDILMVCVMSAASCSVRCVAVGTGSSLEDVDDLFQRGSAVGTVFEIPGITFDVASNKWLTYVLTQRDTDRKLVVTNAVSGIAKDVSRGLISGNPIGALGGLVSGVIGGVTAGINQGIKEEGVQNQTENVSSTGNGAGLLDLGSIVPMLTESPIDAGEKEFYLGRVFRQGYLIGSYMKDPDFHSRTAFDYIHTGGCHVDGNMNENSRKTIEAIFNAGVVVWHDDYTSETAGSNREVSE